MRAVTLPVEYADCVIHVSDPAMPPEEMDFSPGSVIFVSDEGYVEILGDENEVLWQSH